MAESKFHMRPVEWIYELTRRVGRTRVIRVLFSHPAVLALLVAGFLALLITPRLSISLNRYQIGQPAEHPIKADRDFDVEDAENTERRRREAAAAIQPIFDHDANAANRKEKRVIQAFAEMRAFYGWADNGKPVAEGKVASASLANEAAIQEQRKMFGQTLGIALDPKVFDYLDKTQYSSEIETHIRNLLKYALTRLVVHDKAILEDQVHVQASEKAITLRELAGKRERAYGNFAQILDLATLKKQVEQRARNQIDGARRREAALTMAIAMLEPTLDFNRAATEERRAEAREKVGPSIIHFKRNQLIVAEGQPIAEEHMRVLKVMQEGSNIFEFLASLAALTIVFLALLMTLFNFAQNNIRKFRISMRDYGFMITTGALAGVMIWLGRSIAGPLADQYWWLSEEAVLFMFPIAGVCMLVRFLLYSEAALVWLAFVALVAGFSTDGSVGYAAFVMAGSIVGAHSVGRADNSRRVVGASLNVALINVAMAAALLVFREPSEVLSVSAMSTIGGAFFGGLVSGSFLLAALHPFESVFGFKSNIRLMELANLNHPLLGRLLVESPGTYHHCLMVSALAEKGAEAIDANPLLAKVAGLYHDIGKINKPRYFIENQITDENPHDDLPPTMSALILINHVREGLDLAKRYKLGRLVEQVISEHHGRSRINYFYNRAKQQEVNGRDRVNEEDFRYRGPRPQSKESALVMLADVVEAATRSLKNPTPTRLEQMVNELVSDVHNDGQLDECEMTLRDLHRVALQFTTILTGRYHGRIAYPEKEHPRRGKVVNIPSVASGAGEEPEA